MVSSLPKYLYLKVDKPQKILSILSSLKKKKEIENKVHTSLVHTTFLSKHFHFYSKREKEYWLQENFSFIHMAKWKYLLCWSPNSISWNLLLVWAYFLITQKGISEGIFIFGPSSNESSKTFFGKIGGHNVCLIKNRSKHSSTVINYCVYYKFL